MELNVITTQPVIEHVTLTLTHEEARLLKDAIGRTSHMSRVDAGMTVSGANFVGSVYWKLAEADL